MSVRALAFLMVSVAVAVIGYLPVCFAETAAAETIDVTGKVWVTCDGVDGEVRFDMLFEEGAAGEVPQAIAMRVSDPNVSEKRAEIAHFQYADGLLSNTSSVVIGYVDLNNPKTGRKGERIGGTFLGSLRSIMVDIKVDFSAGVSSRHFGGQAIYLKKIGEELVQDLDCYRQK